MWASAIQVIFVDRQDKNWWSLTLVALARPSTHRHLLPRPAMCSIARNGTAINLINSNHSLSISFVRTLTASSPADIVYIGRSTESVPVAWQISGHSRTAWGLALIWIVLSCKWGLAKPVDKLLSYPSLLPLSRLTYCAYLVHPVSQIVMSFDLKGTVHIQHSLVLTIFIGNVMTSYALALLLAVLFEVPFVRMLKILFGKF